MKEFHDAMDECQATYDEGMYLGLAYGMIIMALVAFIGVAFFISL